MMPTAGPSRKRARSTFSNTFDGEDEDDQESSLPQCTEGMSQAAREKLERKNARVCYVPLLLAGEVGADDIAADDS
jgi:hypothetical protein